MLVVDVWHPSLLALGLPPHELARRFRSGNSTAGSGNTTNVTVPPVVTTTAPTAPVQGTRVVTENTCTCTCDTGFFGDECDATAAMTTVAPFVELEYRAARELTFAERETFSVDATAMLSLSTVTIEIDALPPIGTIRRLRLNLVHETNNAEAESRAALQLLRPTERAALERTLEQIVTGLAFVDLTTPTFVLRH